MASEAIGGPAGAVRTEEPFPPTLAAWYAVAMCTDYIFADETMLRYSMVMVTVLFGAAGLWLKFVSLKPYKERVARLIAEQAAPA